MPENPYKPKPDILYMRTNETYMARWRKAARLAGLKLADWVVSVLNAASEPVK